MYLKQRQITLNFGDEEFYLDSYVVLKSIEFHIIHVDAFKYKKTECYYDLSRASQTITWWGDPSSSHFK